jgi:hypothetical protein
MFQFQERMFQFQERMFQLSKLKTRGNRIVQTIK